MTEHLEHNSLGNPEYQQAVTEQTAPDWRRLEVATRRFNEYLNDGINAALLAERPIGPGIARCIANILGRSLGPASALAEYGRTGEGSYQALREEYLSLYWHPAAPAHAQELVDWFGTHLIQKIYPEAVTAAGTPEQPRTLANLLVPTGIQVSSRYSVVHVPGNCNQNAIDNLTIKLAELDFDKDASLRAHLMRPRVNAVSDDVIGGFESVFVGAWPSREQALAAICDVAQRSYEVQEYAALRRIYVNEMTADFEALEEDTAGAYDFVETHGMHHVFQRLETLNPDEMKGGEL